MPQAPLTLQSPELQIPDFDPAKHHRAWQDMIGRWFTAGDIVALATTIGKSARQSVALVKRVNSVDSSGSPHEVRSLKTARHQDANGLWVPAEYDVSPHCTITCRRLLNASAWSRYSGGYSYWSRPADRDSTVGCEKIIKLDMSLEDILKVANDRLK